MKEKIFDFCIHSGDSLISARMSLELKKKLEGKGLSALLFCMSDIVEKFWIENNCTDFIAVPRFKGKDNVDIENAKKTAREYGFPNFRSLYLTEMLFHNYPETYCEKRMSYYVNSVKDIGLSKRAKIYFTYAGDEFDHNTFRLLARMAEGKILYFGVSNLDYRSFITNDDERYLIVPKSKDEIPEEKENYYRQYIEKYKIDKKILWADPKERDVQITISKFKNIFTDLYRSIFLQDRLKVRKGFFEIIKSGLLRIYRREVGSFFYLHNPAYLNNKKYVYFPLHYQYDSQLTLRGLPFFNQTYVIELISRFLPDNYILVVKEHTHARGYYPIIDLRRVKKLSNVKLLPPLVNSHPIMQNAKAVITINSSVGFEALFYSKPVVTLGKSFYRNQGMTIDIDSLYDLGKAFESIDTFDVQESKVIDFLWRLEKSTYDFDGLKFLQSTSSPEELDKVVDALAIYCSNKK